MHDGNDPPAGCPTRPRAVAVGARALPLWLLAAAACWQAPPPGPARDGGERADADDAAAEDDAASSMPPGDDAAGSEDGAAGSRCTQTDALVECAHGTTSLSTSAPDDAPRAVHWQVPLGAPPAAGWPAVVLFQGSFVSAAQSFRGERGALFGMYYQAAAVKALLDAGYAVIAPETRGGGSTYWDTNIPPWSTNWEGSADHRLMLALLDAIGRGTFGPLDGARLFAAGISSGGFMTSRMAVSYRGRFRALAVASGSYATCSALCVVPALPPDHPPTLFLHGRADPLVPVGTMMAYDSALRAQGTPTRVVIDEAAGHEWIAAAPAELLAWFAAHGGS